jgi:2-iminobutanoate/2-iminopropanoate deaminase
MVKFLNPDTIAAPIGRYTHAIETAPNARMLHISGQVGMAKDGRIAEGCTAQAEQIWRNIEAILAAAGMKLTDLVRVNTFLVNAADTAASRAVRQQFLGEHRPASTLLVISALATPDYLIEIEATAVKEIAAPPARATAKPAAKAKAKAKAKGKAKPKAKRRS